MKHNENSEQKELTRKEFFAKWLEQLQQESWQLELLISGFALFGIWEGKVWIDDFLLGLSTNSYSSLSFLVGFLQLLLSCGWTIFFINLLIHVILRGLWIGAIGLRYVSQEIEYDSLGYSDRFTKYLKSEVGDYDDFIERLERLCSVLFAYTFLLFLLLLSLLLFFAVYWLTMVLAVKIGSPQQPAGSMVAVGLTYLMLGLIVFIDFVTLGALKKVKEPFVSKVYLWIYRFYSLVTLSFLYRALLFNFIDEKYTRRLFYLSIPYIIIVLFHSVLISNDPYPYWTYREADDYGAHFSKMLYEDERRLWYDENSMKRELSKEKLSYLTLSQFKVDEPYLEIFIKMYGDDQYILSGMDSIVPFTKPGFRFGAFSSKVKDPEFEKLDTQRRNESKPYRDAKTDIIKKRLKSKSKSTSSQVQIDSLTVIIDSINTQWQKRIDDYKEQRVQHVMKTFLSHARLELDDQPINSELDCYMYKHPNFDEHGLLCMYPTDSLSLGKHLLKLERDTYDAGDDDLRVRTLEVPFYKVR